MRLCDVEFVLTRVDVLGGGVLDRIVLVRVQTDDGIEGWGEAPLPWRLGELARRRELLLTTLAGKNILDLADFGEITELSPPLRAALEMACWDAAGKTFRQPVCRLWGGFYRHQVPVGEFVADLDEEKILEKAQRMYEKGVTWWLLGTSGNSTRDVETLRHIRDQFGNSVQIRLDGRKLYDFTTVVHLCLQLEPLGIHCIVDPLATSSWLTYQRLQQESPIGIALRRGIRTLRDVWSICHCGAGKHIILDLHELGGPLSLRDAVNLVHVSGIEVSLSIPPTVGISLVAAIHLGAALPPLVHAHNAWGYCDPWVLPGHISAKGGMWTVPEEPGWGVVLQRDQWEALALTRDY